MTATKHVIGKVKNTKKQLRATTTDEQIRVKIGGSYAEIEPQKFQHISFIMYKCTAVINNLTGLIFHGGNEGHCPNALEMLQ